MVGTQWITSNSDIYFPHGGNVGIGTNQPNGLGDPGTRTELQVHNSGTDGFSWGDITLSSASTAASSYVGGVGFGSTGITSTDKRTAVITSQKVNAAANDSSGNLLFYTSDGAGLWPVRMIINQLGNIGIGTSSPAAKLDIAGNLQVTGTINSTGVITSASDKRFKKDFTTLDNSLNKILQLKGVGFSWRDKKFGKGKQIGFIAQDVEKIYPELVYTNPQGMKFVAYQSLVAPLVEAIRDQQTEIDTLKKALCEENPNLSFCK